jgi:hypothetical protein
MKGLYLIAILIMITACHNTDKPHFVATVSNVSLPAIKIKRYDLALFALPLTQFGDNLKRIAPAYPLFLNINLNDTSIVNGLQKFAADPSNIYLAKEVQKQYSDITFLEKGLTDAFTRCASFFKEIHAPGVYTFVSGIDYQFPIRYDGDNMAIGIDLFLGADFKPYKRIQIPNYMTRRMTREKILPTCMAEVGKYLLSDQKPGNTLLDRMIMEGKILLLQDASLPDIADNIKIGYTPEQLKWCDEYAGDVWKFMIERQLLYSTNPEETQKFIQDGPFTLSFGKDSPSRIGVWMGWQIVRKYMQENKTVTLEQLFKNMDSQSILEKSGYKPQD